MRASSSSSAWTAVAGAIAVVALLATAPAQAGLGVQPFTPEFSAKITRTGTVNQPVEVSTTISQTAEEATLKRAEVILPVGLDGNNEALANQCSQAAFEAGNCPEVSIIGSAVATLPLPGVSLSGPVALVEPASPGLPDIGIDLRGPAPQKLKGTLGFTPGGRNVVVFDNLPQVPVSAFTLTLNDGPRGLAQPSRDICQPPAPVFDVNFLSHSGATASTTATATVDCSRATGGGGNAGGEVRKPRAKINLGRLDSDEPSMKLRIKAGSEKLRRAKLRLPRELGFASGTAFDRGASVQSSGGKVSVRHNRRGLKLKANKATGAFTAKFAGGALLKSGEPDPGSRLKFRLAVRDVDGKTTRLTVRAK